MSMRFGIRAELRGARLRPLQKRVGGAVLWGGKPVASDVMASRDSVIGVASVITARLRVLTICIARRRGPALRQESLPVLPVNVATPPGETPG